MLIQQKHFQASFIMDALYTGGIDDFRVLSVYTPGCRHSYGAKSDGQLLEFVRQNAERKSPMPKKVKVIMRGMVLVKA